MPMHRALAEQLVIHIGKVWGKPLSVTDEKNTVVASSLTNKIGKHYPAVAEATVKKSAHEFNNDHETAVAVPLRYNEEMVGAVVVHEAFEKIKEHLPVIRSLGELLTQQFYDITKRMADADDQLLFTLLHSDPVRLPQLVAESAVVGYDLERPRLVIVLKAEGFWRKAYQEAADREQREALIADFKRSIYTSLTNFFTRSIDNIVGYLGDDRFVILKDLSGTSEEVVVSLLSKNFRNIFGHLASGSIANIAIGIGRHYDGINGIQDSYREASVALEIGERLKHGLGAHYSADLGLPLLLADSTPEKRQEFINRVLGTIEKDPLLDTIDAFFRHSLNLTETARTLHIHRNTLIYRLDKVMTLSGLDPRNFLDALHLYTAILLKKLDTQ